MHDLMVLDPALPGTLPHADADALRGFAENEKAASTRRAYRADFSAFVAWCAARGLSSLPASPQVVAWHISAIACEGLSVSSIGRRLAGVAYAHKLAKLPSPTGSDDVRAILAGIRRTLGTAPKRKAAATAEHVRLMVDACPPTMIGLRDKALLAFGFAGAFRRSELVALQVSDLEEVPDGYRVIIRRSKTDQTGAGAEIVIPRGLRIRPVATLQEWLQAAAITESYLFRAVHRGGHVRPWGLRGADAAAIVKHYAERAGLDPTEFSGHSLRAGFVTSAAESGASILKMRRRVTRARTSWPATSGVSTCSRTTPVRRSSDLPVNAAPSITNDARPSLPSLPCAGLSDSRLVAAVR
jgi:site-specific recombinase XerD